MTLAFDDPRGLSLHPATGDRDWGFRELADAPPHVHPQPKRTFYFLLMLPAIIVLAAITLYPFFWLIYMSLHEVGLGPRPDVWVGLKNYARLLTDPRYAEGWWLLARYTFLCLSIEIVLGVLLAVILNRSRYEKALVTLLLMPMMMSPVVAGLLYYFLFNGTFGWYHWIFESLGILDGASILGSPATALYGLVMVDVWQWTPLIVLITLAGLKRVPQDQLEASMVDGAGPLQNFFQVSLPNIYPFLLIAVLLRFMDNVRFIDHFLALTGGGPGNATRILPVYLFDVSFRFFDLGRGGAIAVTLLAMTIVVGMLLVKVLEDPATKKTSSPATD